MTPAAVLGMAACVFVWFGAGGWMSQAAAAAALSKRTIDATHVKVRSQPRPALPPTGLGCRGARTDHGVTTIPITVARYPDLPDVVPLVNVCINGKGPFPLYVDTGAVTTIQTRLAEQIGLPKFGPPSKSGGAGCTALSQEFKAKRMSMAGVPLKGQDILTFNGPDLGKGWPRGSIGADVLSRFGAVRIDYAHQTMTVVHKEGQPFFASSRRTKPLPRALVKTKPAITANMPALSILGDVIQTVNIGLGSTPSQPWLIDTGTSTSVVDPSIAKRTRLKPTGYAESTTTYCSRVTLRAYHSGTWKLNGQTLKPSVLETLPSLIKTNQVAGLLGSNLLATYRSIVLDWSGGQLLLGTG